MHRPPTSYPMSLCTDETLNDRGVGVWEVVEEVACFLFLFRLLRSWSRKEALRPKWAVADGVK